MTNYRTAEIVKVQLCLSPPGGPALLYNEGKKMMEQRHLTDNEMTKMGGDAKAYFRGVWTDRGGWRLGARMADQQW
jgi:hypothetical protein